MFNWTVQLGLKEDTDWQTKST